MAVKKSAKAKNEISEDTQIIESPVVNKNRTQEKKKFPRWPAVAVGILLLLVLYWYKTNSWPIVAIVNNQPIFRHTVMTELYKQGGEQIVDSIITEKLIQQELNKKGIKATDAEIEEKVKLIKTSLGTNIDLDQALADRGMNMKDLRDQLALQVGIEKVVSEQVTVSDEEVSSYVKENGTYLAGANDTEKAANAKETIMQSKLQEAINTWIEGLRSSNKVWRVGQKSS